MYTVRSTSLISGAFAVAALAACIAFQFSQSTMPEPLPYWVMPAASVVVAMLAGGVVALSVLCGLRLAKSNYLSSRSAFGVAIVSISVMGVLGTLPIKSHAIMLQMNSETTVSNHVPPSIWLTGLAL